MIFYTPDINGSRYTLNEEESAHAVRVLRLKAHDLLTTVDGRGGWYRAQIVTAHHKHCQIDVLEQRAEYDRQPYRLHIGIAPTKNIDRFEWFVEKAVEIGLHELTPLLCEHSERRQLNTDRLQRIMVAAMKQSQKAYLPQLNPITPVGEWLNAQAGTHCYIAHCSHGDKTSLKTAYHSGQNTTIGIGPEGDFSACEIAQAQACGFREISLGASRLRTETAGVAVCHSIYMLNE